MCGRYTLATIQEQLAEEFDLIEVESLRPRYNIAPTQSVPVVRVLGDNSTRRLEELRWGLVPHWAKDPSVGSRMINARSEEAATKPSFRVPLRRQRCLVPSTGFFEWKVGGDADSRRTKKQPYYFRRRDERVFAFAGMWDRWVGADGKPIETYTILTTSPNELIRSFHDRMPVIVARDQYGLWLDPTVQDVDRLRPLFDPFPAGDMVAYPVSTHVNAPAHDDAECIRTIR